MCTNNATADLWGKLTGGNYSAVPPPPPASASMAPAPAAKPTSGAAVDPTAPAKAVMPGVAPAADQSLASSTGVPLNKLLGQ